MEREDYEPPPRMFTKENFRTTSCVDKAEWCLQTVMCTLDSGKMEWLVNLVWFINLCHCYEFGVINLKLSGCLATQLLQQLPMLN